MTINAPIEATLIEWSCRTTRWLCLYSHRFTTFFVIYMKLGGKLLILILMDIEEPVFHSITFRQFQMLLVLVILTPLVFVNREVNRRYLLSNVIRKRLITFQNTMRFIIVCSLIELCIWSSLHTK